MASSIRSFIAVELSADQSRAVARVTRQLAEKWPEYRWVDPNNLHLTLNFLGDVADEKIPRVCEIMRNTLASHDSFSFELQGLGAFPKTSRPRVIWIGVGEGKSPLSKIHYDLAENLDELRLERDRKAFRPHITLGRIRDRQRWPDSMIEHLENEPGLELGEVDVKELVLFSSHLENTGPIYTAMDRVSLS